MVDEQLVEDLRVIIQDVLLRDVHVVDMLEESVFRCIVRVFQIRSFLIFFSAKIRNYSLKAREKQRNISKWTQIDFKS